MLRLFGLFVNGAHACRRVLVASWDYSGCVPIFPLRAVKKKKNKKTQKRRGESVICGYCALEHVKGNETRRVCMPSLGRCVYHPPPRDIGTGLLPSCPGRWIRSRRPRGPFHHPMIWPVPRRSFLPLLLFSDYVRHTRRCNPRRRLVRHGVQCVVH
jgi:hypothetical protein